MAEKKIVYKNRIEFILLLIINWSFVIASIWTGYVWGLIFFGVCALVTMYPLLDPRKKIVFTGTKEYQEQTTEDFNRSLVDYGIFEYTDTGFTVSLKGPKEVNWNEIRTILAYKLDLIATDELCIEVFCDNNVSFRVTEGTAGWFTFVARLNEQFPTIKEDWNLTIVHPAFEPNLTLLYDRENRSQEEVIRLFSDRRDK